MYFIFDSICIPSIKRQKQTHTWQHLCLWNGSFIKYKPHTHTHTHTKPNSAPDSSFYLSNRVRNSLNLPWDLLKWPRQLGGKWSSKVDILPTNDLVISKGRLMPGRKKDKAEAISFSPCPVFHDEDVILDGFCDHSANFRQFCWVWGMQWLE